MIITKSLQRVGIFFRVFSSRRFDIVRKTFISYIRPILEYNSNIWNPTHKYLVDKLENVQRQFTKRITSISHLTYHERLSILDLESLELRCLRYYLIQYYKILNNLTPLLNYAKYFNYPQPSSSSRKPSLFLVKPINCPNYLSSSFFNRSVWTTGIHFFKHSKKLILLVRLGKSCLWLTCLPF